MERWHSYVVAVPELTCRLRAEPALAFDSTRTSSAPFIEALRCFDQLVYAPLGMRMPRWVLYDCAVVPGMVFGLASDSDDVPDTVRRALELPVEYAGPVPLSMLIAIPEVAEGQWLVYEVLGIDQALPSHAELGLRSMTLRAAVELLGQPRITATVQWGSSELPIHAEYAPLEVLACWLPAHDQPATGVLRYGPAGEAPAAATDELDVTDHGRLRMLQRDIEGGARLWITGVGDGARVPIRLESPR